VRTNATLDLRASKVERYWGAKLHSRLLLLRIIMRMVIIEEAVRRSRIRHGVDRLWHQRVHSGMVSL
jgi:hypothetical protein